ncbi:MAG: FKBP-type peptidyl-prolyl cis-trans isomerase, partial [Bacteroidota bacterium]|nr:FKBP-type peptidyl-prolyl cis-trans isomerase [Bacteroidota bacterium]
LIRYTVRLLNGNICYDNSKGDLRKIKAGHMESERGLEEGILLMRQGDRGKFIVPSHLAFGLLGDQKKIPPGAALVYDVELVEIK